ncbi:hypothetical protein [Mycolicibacterium sphagni]|uniref:hypothetical protein n=1 Tax=Mycolicibacterium sphagni TaxID=1786 RepID=UPI0021F31DD2|nr:hypothetical protein [Mycolicibacterium sphagni]MCV7174762.1 hypothetical protein [Mycolicibacterium sphagni]
MNTGGQIPNAVEPGWEHATDIGDFRLLFYPGVDDVRFEHTCDRGRRGVIRCAPRLTDVNQPGGHQVTGTRESPTVRASILCDDCGTHGFITDGQWAGCG